MKVSSRKPTDTQFHKIYIQRHENVSYEFWKKAEHIWKSYVKLSYKCKLFMIVTSIISEVYMLTVKISKGQQ